MRKNSFSFLAFIVGLQTLSVIAFAQNTEQVITGFVHKTGSVAGDCSFAPPPASEVEASADQQAQDFCGNKGKAVRISDFSYSSNNCVWGGFEYR